MTHDSSDTCGDPPADFGISEDAKPWRELSLRLVAIILSEQGSSVALMKRLQGDLPDEIQAFVQETVARWEIFEATQP